MNIIIWEGENMRVCIDPGHGGTDSGAIGNGYYEKDLNLSVSINLRDYLASNGVDAVLTREKDITLDPNQRIQAVEDSNPEVCLSIHFNASNGKGSGVETIYQINNPDSEKLAKLVLDQISSLGIIKRSAYSKESGQHSGQDYYFMLRKTRPINSIIVECMFIDNPDDMKYMNSLNAIQNIAEAIGKSILNYFEITVSSGKTQIMGAAVAVTGQMEEYLHSVNPNAPYYAQIYLEEGAEEGVRGDIAFAQSLLETNYFKFGGNVLTSQNNFAGLGASGTSNGISFSSPKDGIRAQIQHLKAYASTLPINNPVIDIRLNYVKRGSATNIEDLNGKWAVPGTWYGQKIIYILNKILEAKVDVPHWSKPYFDNLKQLGIIEDQHDPESTPTWGELAAIVSKTVDYLSKKK